MPKIVDYERRRREIAEKAVPVFAEDGFHDTNLSKIAGLCGFGRTTIYKYFKDKDEIFLFVLADIFERLETAAAAIVVDHSRDAIDRLEGLLESMVRDSIEDRNRMLIVLDLILRLKRDEGAFSSETRERLVGLRAYYERVLTEGMASGEIREGDPAALASVLFSIVESFVLQRSLFDSLSFDKSLEATRLFIEGLRVR
jgi:AcrR family transcriptional regulator